MSAAGAILMLLLVLAAAWTVAVRIGSAPVRGDAPSASPDVRTDDSGARTKLAGLTPPSGEPLLPGLATTHPAPGAIARLPGPFDERFTWSRLRLSDTGISGTVTITSDVSDVLELQVLAGFYDRNGRLLGSRRFVHHAVIHDEGSGTVPNETQDFAVALPPEWADRAVSAAVGVPVLVNE
jgi:hypothetical protein